MSADASTLKRAFPTLLISISTVSVFLLLFIFRSIDDNRLTSWQWVFAGVDLIRVLLFLVIGIIIAYALSRFPPPERYTAIFLFFSSFVVGAFFWQEPEVIVDASRYFTQAKQLKVYGIKYFIEEWGRGINAWTDLPFIPFLYGLIFKFFGESRIYIQIFTTALFSMTSVLTYLIGKTLWNEEVGSSAGGLLLGIPYLITQVPLMLVDVPAMFFFTFTIFAFIKALERGGVWVAASSVAIFLTAFSKYSTWLMLSVLVIIFLVYLIRGTGTTNESQWSMVGSQPQRTLDNGQRTAIRGHIIYRGTLVALIAGFFIGVVILLNFDLFSSQIKLLIDYQKPGLKRWGERFVSTFFYQIHPFITIAALYSVYTAFKKRDLRHVIISWLILLVIVLQIQRARYTLIIFPMLTLMASYGLQEIRNKEIRRFLASCIVFSSLVVAIFVYLPFLQKMSSVNLKNAGRFLNSIDEKNIEVLTIFSKNQAVNPAVAVPILDLFTEKDLHYHYDARLSPPLERIKESPLRFTWEYKNPDYYAVDNSKNNAAVVVIPGRMDDQLPVHIEQKINGYKKTRIFKTSTGVFHYRSIVIIYQPERKAP